MIATVMSAEKSSTLRIKLASTVPSQHKDIISGCLRHFVTATFASLIDETVDLLLRESNETLVETLQYEHRLLCKVVATAIRIQANRNEEDGSPVAATPVDSHPYSKRQERAKAKRQNSKTDQGQAAPSFVSQTEGRSPQSKWRVVARVPPCTPKNINWKFPNQFV